MTSTRDRLLTEGMRLFGEKGYAATSVAQIEAAAGLSPGSGSLYKHFRSKEELLETGLDRLLSSTDRALPQPPGPSSDPPGPSDPLTALARAGLRRMEQDRDLNRLVFRGLGEFPRLLQRFGSGEIGRIHEAATALLTDQAGPEHQEQDWEAITLVLQGAVAHYWLLTDVFGEHPTGVDEERLVAGVAALAGALLRSVGDDDGPSATQ